MARAAILHCKIHMLVETFEPFAQCKLCITWLVAPFVLPNKELFDVGDSFYLKSTFSEFNFSDLGFSSRPEFLKEL